MFTKFPCHIQNTSFKDLNAIKTFVSNEANSFEAWESIFWQQVLDWCNPDKDHMEVFSSGSTGEPRRIRHEKKCMMASAQATLRYFSIESGTLLLCLPADKIGGLMMVVRALTHGLTLQYIKPSAVLGLAEINKIELLALTPHQAMKTLENINHTDLRQVKNWLIGGAGVPFTLLQKIESLEINAFESFGMTETISHIALRRVSEEEKPFRLLEHVEMSVNEKDQTLILNSEVLGLKKLQTHDVIEMIDLRTFFWKGRTDFVINSGGIKLHPEILEKKITPLIPFPFFIASKNDSVFGQRPILICETDGPDVDLYQAANAMLSGVEKLSGQINVQSFEYTGNGKISRLQTLACIDKSC